MSDEERAKELLVSSYSVSADRIQEALSRSIKIRNSRKPGSPPQRGEVIGLCGQSGRHPYFRISIRDLEQALIRIRQATRRRTSPQAAEEIATICSELRQRTFFDSGTGCVNDQMPSMVPLLPPEEIWFDGRELPLDVWRLISFEYDLVSSAVSLQTSIPDFRFGAFNQNALAFRFLMRQLGDRFVRFEAQPEDLTGPWKSLLLGPRVMDVSLARLFFEAGSLLTPFAPDDIVRYYAALRYMHWISEAGSELRVKDQFDRDSVDSRYKGLFSEEIAIGLMAVILGDVFNARPINNTAEVAPSIPSGGPVADFISQAPDPSTNHSTTIIAESKGSIKNPVSASRRRRAKQQVASTNLFFAGARRRLPLTFCSTVYFEGQAGPSHCVVADPPEEEFGDDSIELNPEEAWRVAYSKMFRFVGLETAARQVARGDAVDSLRPIDFDRKEDRRRSEQDGIRLRRASMARERFRSELLLDVGESAVSIDSNVLDVLREGIREGGHEKLDHLLDFRRQSFEKRPQLASFNSSLGVGLVYYRELDDFGDRLR